MKSTTLEKHQAAAPVLNTEAAECWDIGNRAEAEVEKLGRAAMPFVLVAGAAFHLAKAQVAHGQWEHLVEACSPISLRRVQARMQSVDAALMRLKVPLDERSYKAIVFSSKLAKTPDPAFLETKFVKHLSTELNNVFAGRNEYQLEIDLGIRKPKALKPKTDRMRSPEENGQWLAERWVTAVEGTLQGVTHHLAHLTSDQLARFHAAVDAAEKAINPNYRRP